MFFSMDESFQDCSCTQDFQADFLKKLNSRQIITAFLIYHAQIQVCMCVCGGGGGGYRSPGKSQAL